MLLQHIVYTLAGTHDKDLEDYVSRSFACINLDVSATLRGEETGLNTNIILDY